MKWLCLPAMSKQVNLTALELLLTAPEGVGKLLNHDTYWIVHLFQKFLKSMRTGKAQTATSSCKCRRMQRVQRA